MRSDSGRRRRRRREDWRTDSRLSSTNRTTTSISPLRTATFTQSNWRTSLKRVVLCAIRLVDASRGNSCVTGSRSLHSSPVGRVISASCLAAGWQDTHTLLAGDRFSSREGRRNRMPNGVWLNECNQQCSLAHLSRLITTQSSRPREFHERRRPGGLGSSRT